MVKGKRLTYYCIDKACGFKVTNNKTIDGMSCPDCKGMIGVRPAAPPGQKV
ncbi:MAG TPA: hypothetical protein IAA29_06615 [Candidatus Paenibacillus intestinavium]|nr:hypothetical protein [Candidatus Paenibacillus intestinavium]